MDEAEIAQFHACRAGRCRGCIGCRAADHGKPVLGKAVERGKRGLAGRAVVPDGRQHSERIEEGRRQQQYEQAFRQRQLAAPGAEADLAQKMKADIGRGHRNAERGKQLEHSGCQEGDFQHRHGAPPQVFGAIPQAARDLLNGIEGADGLQPAQPVEQEGVERSHVGKVLFARRLRAPADQRHEDGDQGRCDQKHQRRDPGIGKYHRQYGERHHARLEARGLEAGKIGHDMFGLLCKNAGGFARGGPTGIERRTSREGGDRDGALSREDFSGLSIGHAVACPLQESLGKAERQHGGSQRPDLGNAIARRHPSDAIGKAGGLRQPHQFGKGGEPGGKLQRAGFRRARFLSGRLRRRASR